MVWRPEQPQIFVDSSERLHRGTTERMVAGKFREGFSHDLSPIGSVSHEVSVRIHRSARPSWGNWDWFAMEEPQIDEDQGRIAFMLALNVPRAQQDPRAMAYRLDEGDIAEIVGFYLRLWVLRLEQPETDFQGQKLSEYRAIEGFDELWPEAFGYYVGGVLRKDRG